MNLVAERMTDDLEEFAATAHVQPPLQMPTAGVVAFVDIGGERRKSGIGAGPGFAGVTPIAKLGFVAFTAPRAGYAKHGRFFQ